MAAIDETMVGEDYPYQLGRAEALLEMLAEKMIESADEWGLPSVRIDVTVSLAHGVRSFLAEQAGRRETLACRVEHAQPVDFATPAAEVGLS